MDQNPFASPSAPAARRSTESEYNSVKLWADLAVYVVVIAVIAQGVGLYLRSVVLWELTQNHSDVEPNGTLYDGVHPAERAVLQFVDVSLILTAIAVPTWMANAHRNLSALGARELQFSSLGCVIAWLIPGVNLFEPRHALRELWRASQPTRWEPPDTGWQRNSAPIAIDLWWMFTLLAAFGLLTFRGLMAWNPTLRMVIQGNRALLLAELLAIVAGVLLVRLIREISDAQETRYALLSPEGTERGDVSRESIPLGE